MFKKRQSKKELRLQLEAEVSRFLESGGEIKQVEMGASGLVDGQYNTHKGQYPSAPSQTRTPVSGLLATIDARKKTKTNTSLIKKSSRPKQKVIYDDFGEPLRTVWVEDA